MKKNVKKIKPYKIYHEDCRVLLEKLKPESVDLIITSPPYADNRKETYGGIPIKEYVEWFLPISEKLKIILKDEGSFVLNIKEKTVEGERSTYVLELILAMREQGWLWTEEYIWHKKNSFPGKWPNRFRDAWERCLHFTKQKDFNMYQEEVMVPMGKWADSRIRNPSKNDSIRHESKVNSGLGRNVSNWTNRERAYPTNVLHMATECGNVNHSAAFPIALPTWFIKLFTKKGDIVFDPFMGSGTTGLAAINLDRKFIGTEIHKKYYKTTLERIKNLEKNTKKQSLRKSVRGKKQVKKIPEKIKIPIKIKR